MQPTAAAVALKIVRILKKALPIEPVPTGAANTQAVGPPARLVHASILINYQMQEEIIVCHRLFYCMVLQVLQVMRLLASP
jgi:hypothetical protein